MFPISKDWIFRDNSGPKLFNLRTSSGNEGELCQYIFHIQCDDGSKNKWAIFDGIGRNYICSSCGAKPDKDWYQKVKVFWAMARL